MAEDNTNNTYFDFPHIPSVQELPHREPSNQQLHTAAPITLKRQYTDLAPNESGSSTLREDDSSEMTRDPKVRIITTARIDELKARVNHLEQERKSIEERLQETLNSFRATSRDLGAPAAVLENTSDLESLQHLLSTLVLSYQQELEVTKRELDKGQSLLELSAERETELQKTILEETNRANNAETALQNAHNLAEHVEKEQNEILINMNSCMLAFKDERDEMSALLKAEQERACQSCHQHLLDISGSQKEIEHLVQELQMVHERLSQSESFQAEHLNKIQGLEGKNMRLLSLKDAFEDGVTQLQDKMDSYENRIRELRLTILSREEDYKTEVDGLRTSLDTYQTESLNKVETIEKEFDAAKKREAELTQLTHNLNQANAGLERQCVELQELLQQKDEAFHKEEEMVSLLRQQFNKQSRGIGIPGSSALDEAMDITMDTLGPLPSLKALGKRPEASTSRPVTPISNNRHMPNNAPVLIAGAATQDLTFFQRNSLEAAFTPPPTSRYINQSASRNVHRIPALLSPVRPPGESLRLCGGTTNRFVTPSIYTPRAQATHSSSRVGNTDTRQATPGPSNSHNSNPVPGIPSDGISHNLAETLVHGMERMTKAIGSLESAVLESSGNFTSDNAPKSRSKTFSPFKKAQTRKPRTKDHVDITRDVRKTMNQMLGIKRDQDIVNAVQAGHSVTEDVANSLSDADIDDVMDNLVFMKPFWETLKCDYNALLTRLFVSHFLSLYPEYEEQEDTVESHFNQRLTGLRNILSRAEVKPGETVEDAARQNQERKSKRLRDARVRHRKWEGYWRRVNDLKCLAEADPTYETALNVISTLGVDGYSLDKSCPEGHYLVHHLPWRSHNVRPFVDQAIDAHPTVNTNGNSLSGGQMRKRIYPVYPTMSLTPAPEGLPRNLYEDAWYNSLTYANQRALNVGPEVSVEPDFDMVDI